MSALEIVGGLVSIAGGVLLFLAALGLIRMPDVFNRMQAGTKATTLGAFSLILGVGLANPSFLGKGILLIVFIVLTNPISSSIIARSGRRSGVPMAEGAVVDEYATVLDLRKNSSAESFTKRLGNTGNTDEEKMEVPV